MESSEEARLGLGRVVLALVSGGGDGSGPNYPLLNLWCTLNCFTDFPACLLLILAAWILPHCCLTRDPGGGKACGAYLEELSSMTITLLDDPFHEVGHVNCY